jgi:hypothetical protein
MSQIDAFIRDLRRDPRFAGANGALVDQLAAWFEEVDLGGVENVHDDQFLGAAKSALSLPISLTEKAQLLFRLISGKFENLDVRDLSYGLQ